MKRNMVFFAACAAAAVLMQGFQCGSAEMTTARRALQQKDYKKAKQALSNVLAANPNDVDALIMLGGAYDGLEQSDSAVLTYQRALNSPTIKPDQKNLVAVTLFQQWATAFNSGVKAFNEAAGSTGNAEKLNQARDAFRTATRIKPEYSEVYGNLGETLERLGDTAAAVEAYMAFWNAEKAGIEAMATAGVTLGSARGDVIKIFGTPQKTKMDSIDQGVLYSDAFTYGGTKVYVYSYAESTEDAKIEGWRYDPAPTLSQAEVERARILSVAPLKNLAFIAYGKEKFVEALTWADAVAKVRPQDQELAALRAQSLARSGKADAAINDLKKQLAKDPSSVALRMQLISMYSNLEKYDEVLQLSDEVLAIEPTNEGALYDAGAASKNLAVVKQQEQFKLMDANPKHSMDSTYLRLLARSASYFERLRSASARYRDDFIVIGELANTYEVRKETAKVRALISELEALEVKYANDSNYYRVLEGLYARNKMTDKMKEVQAKGAKLNGK